MCSGPSGERGVEAMTDTVKMTQHIIRTLQRLRPEYLKKVMVCADTYYSIQLERGG